MKRGIVKFFNTTKGYGFVTDEATGKDVFIHATGLKTKPIVMNDYVEYEEQDGQKGLLAVNVCKIG